MYRVIPKNHEILGGVNNSFIHYISCMKFVLLLRLPCILKKGGIAVKGRYSSEREVQQIGCCPGLCRAWAIATGG